MNQRKLLAEFLRWRRESMSPRDVGIEATSRRRTPGLRREEIAQLSGISVTWYTWLEQGREITVSRQVLESLGRALRLSSAERRHLYVLAGAPMPPEVTRPVAVTPMLRAMVDILDPNPAHVINPCWDLLAYNRAYASLVGGLDELPVEERNSIWLLFTRSTMRDLLVDWQRETRIILDQFRASVARHPDDPRTSALVESLLSASPAFAAMWAEHSVGPFSPAIKRFSHPQAGRLDLSYTEFTVADDTYQHLVVFLPATPADAARLRHLIETASVSQRPDH